MSLAEIAAISGGELHSAADPARMIEDVAALDTARASELSFLDNNLYIEAFRQSGAGACFVRPEKSAEAPAGMNLLLTKEPYRCFALAARAFYPEPERIGEVSAAATVDATAAVGAGTVIRPGAVVEAGAEIGRRCMIEANAVIGRNVVVGDDCVIGAGTSLSHAVIGDRVRIYAGARLGEAGFGFATGADGRHVSVPQLGRVIVGNEVEVGANTTIDRGAGPDTIIGDGCRIDNLVQIGHNVELGRGCIIVSQVGISGSTKLEDYVVAGGQAGIAGHLRIGTGAQLGAQTGIMRDVPAGARLLGSPAVPAIQFFRQVSTLATLAEKKGK